MCRVPSRWCWWPFFLRPASLITALWRWAAAWNIWKLDGWWSSRCSLIQTYKTLIHQNNNGAGGSLSFKVSRVRQEQLRPEAFFLVTLKTQTLSCLVGKKSRIWELQASFKKNKHHRRRTATMLCTSTAFLYCPTFFSQTFSKHTWNWVAGFGKCSIWLVFYQ